LLGPLVELAREGRTPDASLADADAVQEEIAGNLRIVEEGLIDAHPDLRVGVPAVAVRRGVLVRDVRERGHLLTCAGSSTLSLHRFRSVRSGEIPVRS
jgi:hypothetical protein